MPHTRVQITTAKHKLFCIGLHAAACSPRRIQFQSLSPMHQLQVVQVLGVYGLITSDRDDPMSISPAQCTPIMLMTSN